MSLSVQCHACAQRYKVSDTAAGKKITCPKCGAVFQVAAPPPCDDLMPPSRSGVFQKSPLERPNESASAPHAEPPARPTSKPNPATPPTRAAAPASLPPSKSAPRAAPIAPAVPVAGTETDSVTSAPTVTIPRAPLAAPVAQPVHAAGGPPPAGAAASVEAGLEPVQSDTMAELLDEQEREDRTMFRGLRRRLRRPPDIREILAFLATHKLAAAVGLISLFVVAELFRSGQSLAGLVFLIASLGVLYLGVAEAFAGGTLFQASAWCYLMVLVAFPILLKYREELGLMGGKVLSNPKQVARAPAAPATGGLPQAPTVLDENSEPEATEASDTPPVAAATTPSQPGSEPSNAPASDDTTGAPRPEADSSPPTPMAETPATETPTTVPMPIVPLEAETSRPAIPLPDALPTRSLDISREDTLRQYADKAFAEDDMTSGLRYLYAGALAHPESAIWPSIRWSPLLSRPILAVRFGAVVQLDDLASQLMSIRIGDHVAGNRSSLESQRTLGVAFAQMTDQLGGRHVITWLRQNYDDGKLGDLELIRAPAERQLRGCTYLWADTGSEILRTARAQEIDLLFVFDIRGVQNPGSAPTLAAAARLVDVANRQNLDAHSTKSRGLPAGRATLARDVEATLKALGKEPTFGEAPASVDAQAIETRVKAAAARVGENPLPLCVELTWYGREKLLPAEKVQELLTLLVGADGAKALVAGPETSRAQLLMKWLPRRAD